MKQYILFILLTTFLVSCNKASKKDKIENTTPSKTVTKPNIVLFYVDDLGYADIGSYGAIGVETPNVDRLAQNGIQFTDAHSSAATCTPSRYSLLTGEYAFRNKAAILPGDAPLLIRPGKPTLPQMLKKVGYKTAVVGKWHLGLGDGQVDWNKDVKPGPLEIGFDYSFLLPATGDRVPTVYLENHSVTNLNQNDPIEISYKKPIGKRPTGVSNPELLKQKADLQHSATIVNGISRIGYQKGGESALWVDEEFPNVFTQKAKQFINTNKDEPFFLFFSFHDIHVPRVPNKRFQGKSTMGPRGDAIAQMDWMTGEIIKELEKLNLDKNTLVIFTSDNGPVLDDGYADQAVELIGEHNPSGIFRGGKYSAYEAGTRVPMITYWPEKIQTGKSDALISQVDYYASIANLLNIPLDKQEAIDSKNIINALLDSSQKANTQILEESYTLGIRTDEWKYIEPYTGELPNWMKNKDIENGILPKSQLFNIKKDPSEQNNIAKENPELVKKFKEQIQKIVEK
ncbi:arylsulfatase [Flavobacteriaceae bacterium UJ101]|nr:arylsulfatase [Flavobacteriaceae bacterium UJ101]